MKKSKIRDEKPIRDRRKASRPNSKKKHRRLIVDQSTAAPPISVKYFVRDDEHNQAWFLVEALVSGEVKEHRIKASIFTSARKLLENLKDFGCLAESSVIEAFRHHVNDNGDEIPKMIVSQVGRWHGRTLLTRHGTFGRVNDGRLLAFDPNSSNYAEAVRAGTLQDYLTGVEPFLQLSDELCVGYLAGLAAPLCSLLGLKPGLALCFTGEGSTGKTTVLLLAQSLSTIALDDADLVDFSNTTGVLLDSLPNFGGVATPFTDIKAAVEKQKALVEKIQTLSFSSSANAQRSRLTDKVQKLKALGLFNLILLTAEHPIKHIYESAGVQRERGDTARLIDINVASAAEGGIFPGLSPERRQRLFVSLKSFFAANHGTVLPAWCEKLADCDVEKLETQFDSLRLNFQTSYRSGGSLQQRVATSMSTLSAVANIAFEMGLLPIPLERAETAIKNIVERIDVEQGDELEGLKIRVLKRLVSPNRFPTLAKGQDVPRKRSGFCRVENTEPFIYVAEAEFIRSFPETSRENVKRAMEWLKSTDVVQRKNGKLTSSVDQGSSRKRRLKLSLKRLKQLRRETLSAAS